MKIDGYEVFDYKLIIGGDRAMINADRPCDCCLKSDSKKIKVSLEGLWEEKMICQSCMIKGGLFLSFDDLQEELDGF